MHNKCVWPPPDRGFMSQLSTFGISKNIYFKYVQALYQTLLLSMNFGQKKQKKKINCYIITFCNHLTNTHLCSLFLASSTHISSKSLSWSIRKSWYTFKVSSVVSFLIWFLWSSANCLIILIACKQGQRFSSVIPDFSCLTMKNFTLFVVFWWKFCYTSWSLP